MPHSAQTDALMAATGNAFTTVFAGFAFTCTILPKISRFPALVAGFKRVFTMQTPGIVNLPSFFTCLAATSANAPKTFAHSERFISQAADSWSAISVFEMDLAPFIGRIAFMAFMDFIGAMSARTRKDTTEQNRSNAKLS